MPTSLKKDAEAKQQPAVVVIGASAGGVDALRRLVAGLPKHLNAAVFIVLHTAPNGPALLDGILQKNASLAVAYPQDKETIVVGKIYLAPPDRHLLVERTVVRIVRGPKENRHRPGVDPLFRSAAVHFGSRTIGIVLTGYLDDGTAGLIAIKKCGGISIVQDPAEALYPSMPLNALTRDHVDYSVRLDEMPSLIERLANAHPTERNKMDISEKMRIESEIASLECTSDHAVEKLGRSSPVTCPECGGGLWEITEDVLRYRCHLGHAYSMESLLEEQTEMIDKALNIALRALEENARTAVRLLDRAHQEKDSASGARFQTTKQAAESAAVAIREMLLRGNLPKTG